MQDQPETTPEEHEQVREEQEEHESMRGAGHERPPDVEELTPADEEIHDA